MVPFTIACGECFFCKRGNFSVCERSNRNKQMADKSWATPPAGLFGYSHLTGGYPGGQAEYLRVPYADVGPIKVPGGLSDEQVLFLSDIFPTGWQAAVQCDIKPGDTVAVWGCGPVGQFAIRSAVPPRCQAGHRDRPRAGAAGDGRGRRRDPIDFEDESVIERLND